MIMFLGVLHTEDDLGERIEKLSAALLTVVLLELEAHLVGAALERGAAELFRLARVVPGGDATVGVGDGRAQLRGRRDLDGGGCRRDDAEERTGHARGGPANGRVEHVAGDGRARRHGRGSCE